LGGGTVVGDMRWTGTYGVSVDLIARTHCSVEVIKYEDVLVFIQCNDHADFELLPPIFYSELTKNAQGIMGKFEFFPIKCRTQRAWEIYKHANKSEAHDWNDRDGSSRKIKMKVCEVVAAVLTQIKLFIFRIYGK
jgi:hypothetical protein